MLAGGNARCFSYDVESGTSHLGLLIAVKTVIRGFNFEDFHAFVPTKVELTGRSERVVREARGMVKSNYKMDVVNRLIGWKGGGVEGC